MPENRSRDLYRGLLIPDGDITEVWEDVTTVDQAGNRSGVPLAQDRTEMVIQSQGSQSDTEVGRELEILTLRGGYAGTYESAFGWKPTAEAGEPYRGWDTPLPVSQLEVIDYNANAEQNLHPHLVGKVNEDGTDHLFCFFDFASGATPANLRVQVHRRDDQGWLGGTWPRTVATTKQPYPGAYCYPTGLVLPSGRILVFYLSYSTEELTATTPIRANVRMAYSDDNAETWEEGSSYCLENAIIIANSLGGDDTTSRVHRIRAAYKDGQILLLIWTRRGPQAGTDASVITQYASDDLGTSFTEISNSADVDIRAAFPDITVGGSNFVVGWLGFVGNFGSVRVDNLSSAFEPINWAVPEPTWVTVTSTRNDTPSPDWQGIEADGDLALCTDYDGAVYIYFFNSPYAPGGVNDSSNGNCYVSLEGGAIESFQGVGHGFGGGTSPQGFNVGCFFKPETNDAEAPYIRCTNLTAAPHRGRIVIAHRAVGGDGGQEGPIQVTAEGSLYVYYLGGFTTVCMPSLGTFSRASQRSCFGSTWFPYTVPGNATGGMWTEVATGVPAINAIVTPGRYHLQTPPGMTYYFEDLLNPSGTGFIDSQVAYDVGLMGRFTYEVNSAPSAQRVNVLVSNGVGGGVEVSMLISQAGIRILDTISSTTLANIAPPFGPLNTKIQVLWALRGIEGGPPFIGEFSLWYREWSADEDRVWIEGVIAANPVEGAAIGDSRIQWGDVDLPRPSDMFWDEFQFTYGSVDDYGGLRYNNVGLQLSDGQESPRDLFGRSFATSPVYIDADTRLQATDGPTFEGDQWAINVRHLLGYENVLTQNSPSPSIVWRSKTATNSQIIAFRRNPDSVNAFPANDLYGVHFENVNFKACEVEALIGGAWTLLGAVDLSRPFEYQREGHTVRVRNAQDPTENAFYIEYNELKGCRFEFSPGEQQNEIAIIDRNSEGIGYSLGAGANTGNTKRATLFMDPDSYDEALTPAQGTGRVWFKTATVLFNLPTSSEFEAIRIRLCPGATTLPKENFYEAGNIILGSVAVFGWDYSRDRIVNREANTSVETNIDGTRHAYVRGKTVKEVRFSWAEGVDISELRREYASGSEDWGYVKTWGGLTSSPVAMRQDGPLLMNGLVDRLEGPAVPVVYLPRITYSDDTMLIDPRQSDRGAIYGRIVSKVTRETAVGSEETNEVYRVNTVTIEGER